MWVFAVVKLRCSVRRHKSVDVAAPSFAHAAVAAPPPCSPHRLQFTNYMRARAVREPIDEARGEEMKAKQAAKEKYSCI